MTEKTLLQQYVQIGVVVAAYWFISITLGKGNYYLTIEVVHTAPLLWFWFRSSGRIRAI